jgi:biotin carboxylase
MSAEKHLLLIATTTGYQTRIFAEAARRLGVRLTLATDRCHVLEDPWGDNAVAVRLEDPAGSLEILVEAHAGRGPFTGIAALGDRTTFLAALFAERCRLRFHSPAAVEAARNKFLSKERFRAAGLRQPEYRRIPISADAEEAAGQVVYPAVLKPLGLSASRGVIRVDSPAGFLAAFRRIEHLLSNPDIVRMRDEQDRFVQVESFIPGEEFAIEALITGGRCRVLAIFDKPDPLDGPYFEETIYVTPSRKPLQVRQALIAALERGVAALGLSHGPAHGELRFNEEGAWLLEIAARPIGGLCAKALRFQGGAPLEDLILRHALGVSVEDWRLLEGASGVMMIPVPKPGVFRGVEGVDDARAVKGIQDILITAKDGQYMQPFPESNSYPGFVFARAETPAEVERALRDAHGRLHFDIAAELLK